MDEVSIRFGLWLISQYVIGRILEIQCMYFPLLSFADRIFDKTLVASLFISIPT